MSGLTSVAPQNQTYAGARLSILLEASDLGNKRILLTAADTERARPRKTATGMMANFWRFLRFPPKTLSRLGQFLAKAGIAENAKALEGQGESATRRGCSTSLAPPLSDSSIQRLHGHISADSTKRNLPATSLPADECRLCCSITAVSDRLRAPGWGLRPRHKITTEFRAETVLPRNTLSQSVFSLPFSAKPSETLVKRRLRALGVYTRAASRARASMFAGIMPR